LIVSGGELDLQNNTTTTVINRGIIFLEVPNYLPFFHLPLNPIREAF
jgi:hypothetical protein